MLINTRIGQLDIEENKVIKFKEGLVGLENLKNFILVEHKEGSCFKFLQSVDDPEMTFVVTEPNLFYQNYFVELSDEDVEFLDLEKPEDAVVLCTAFIPEDPGKATINLQGPLVLNSEKRQGKQLIINRENITTAHPLFGKGQDSNKAHGGD